MNLLFEGISLLICIGIPVLGGIYFAVNGKGYFLTFLTGIHVDFPDALLPVIIQFRLQSMELLTGSSIRG